MAQKKTNLMVGKWIPTDRDLLLKWVKETFKKVKAERAQAYAKLREFFPDAGSEEEILREFIRNASKIDQIAKVVPLHKSILALIKAMGTEPDIGMLIVQMFLQQDGKGLNTRDSIFFLDYLITFAPRFISEDSDLNITIPVPFGCFLTYAMATPAGFAAFIKDRVNELFKDILNEFQDFLLTGSSCYVLVNDIPGGWFTDLAKKEMQGFNEDFQCDPIAPYHGFPSFDAFFTRLLRPNARPVAKPDDPLTIVNACENAPYKISYVVDRYDAFWIKTQPYSLQYILNNDPLVERFVGGTVFQGFLSPHTYHRFHAPVSGKIVKKEVLGGTYFAQPYYKDSAANYIASQPYLAHVAARGIIIIDTENADVGMVAFVPIGMVDVSSVDLSMLDGKTRVTKGDNIGTFHFGGSSHLLIFEKGKRLAFDLQGIQPDPLGNAFLKVNSRIATIVKD